MSTATIDPQATRRVPLTFDDKGNPVFQSCTSPESFKQRALCVVPPHTVIPVIFVPGIMGTNLRLKSNPHIKSWSPPNGGLAGLGAAFNGMRQGPSERQVLFDPANTEVDPGGPYEVPSSLAWLDTKEAKRRGWGALHADSYHGVLQQLETSLNDQYSRPGLSEAQGNYLLPEIGLLGHLGGNASDTADGRPDYGRYAREAAQAWGITPPPLSGDELLRLDDYYYPVWAHGYNWLKSNEQSARSLVDKIDAVIEHYRKSDYFHCDGKVILVTHSMGGLVGRRAAQLVPDKVLGVVHGVQPVAGAPVVYRRFRAGTEVGGPFDLEGAAVAAIIGWDAADITPSMACSPGPLELLPTQHYPPGWLQIVKGTGREERVLIELPQTDPYEEIYGKSTDDCWWGMVDPALIDPKGLMGDKPLKHYRKALDEARGFHDRLGLYAPPYTYGYYGIDDSKYRTFGKVRWETEALPDGDALPLLINRDAERTLTGKAAVPLREGEQARSRVTLRLGNERNQAGDGTVPLDSARVLDRLDPPPQAVFRLEGINHQMSYANRFAIQATIYGIARLAQLAAPAQPYEAK